MINPIFIFIDGTPADYICRNNPLCLSPPLHSHMHTVGWLFVPQRGVILLLRVCVWGGYNRISAGSWVRVGGHITK